MAALSSCNTGEARCDARSHPQCNSKLAGGPPGGPPSGGHSASQPYLAKGLGPRRCLTCAPCRSPSAVIPLDPGVP